MHNVPLRVHNKKANISQADIIHVLPNNLVFSAISRIFNDSYFNLLHKSKLGIRYLLLVSHCPRNASSSRWE